MLAVTIVILSLLALLATMTLFGDTDFKLFKYIGIAVKVIAQTLYVTVLALIVIITFIVVGTIMGIVLGLRGK